MSSNFVEVFIKKVEHVTGTAETPEHWLVTYSDGHIITTYDAIEAQHLSNLVKVTL